ncbi:MAG: hypothetical protein Q8R78_04345 [Candidatus Omnitrophota bacterium]|nr:hypothetical protein [Candidatus Omnitrophota bacterium]
MTQISLVSRSRPRIDFAMGMLKTEQQTLLPRFRTGSGNVAKYAFAWPFRRAPHHWFVILPGETWGTMSADDFLYEWMPSNQEARRVLDLNLKRIKDGRIAT